MFSYLKNLIFGCQHDWSLVTKEKVIVNWKGPMVRCHYVCKTCGEQKRVNQAE